MTRAPLALLLLCACQPSSQGSQGEAQAASGKAHGAVIARAAGQAIGVDDVKEVAEETGLSPEQALDRLVAEALLNDLAAQKGYGDTARMQRELQKARARALLEQEVEATVSEATLSAEAVRARFDKLKPSLSTPETREVVRLTFKKPKGSDGKREREAAERALSRLRPLDPSNHRSEMGVIAAEALAAGFDVKLSGLHARADRKKPDPTEEAARALSGPGLVPRAVENRSGFSVVLLEAIKPPVEAQLADHEASIRETLLQEGRKQRTDQLVSTLRQRVEVTYDEDAIARAFADEALGSAR